MHVDPYIIRLPSLKKDYNGSKVQISRPRIIERCFLNQGPTEPNTVRPDSTHKNFTAKQEPSEKHSILEHEHPETLKPLNPTPD